MDRKRRRAERELEGHLRSLRAEPRPELVERLTSEVLTASRGLRSPWRRLGVAVALTGLMIVAVASFGGVSYGSSAARQAVKQVFHPQQPPAQHRKARTLASTSAADAQYGHFTPPTTPKTPSGGGPTTSGGGGKTSHGGGSSGTGGKTGGGGKSGATGGQSGTTGGTGVGGATSGTGTGNAPTTSTLPFTGLALWIPLAIGLLLIGVGVALRVHARRPAPRS
jgi:hypothetical protein